MEDVSEANENATGGGENEENGRKYANETSAYSFSLSKVYPRQNFGDKADPKSCSNRSSNGHIRCLRKTLEFPSESLIAYKFKQCKGHSLYED